MRERNTKGDCKVQTLALEIITPLNECTGRLSRVSTRHKHNIAERLRAIFSMDCAIPDTSMVFGTVVDHDRLSIFRYRTTLTNVHCACAVHFRATRFWYKHENCVIYNTMAYLFIRIMKLGTFA